MPEKKTGLTPEQLKKWINVEPGSWFIRTEVCFYAVLTDGKVTVPKEVIEHVKLKDDQMVHVTIDHA